MKQKNKDLLRKFEIMKDWMVADTRSAMYLARANFLVAQGLLNYTEIIGSFIKPDGNAGERFDAFFERMGTPYKDLLKRFNRRRKRHPHVVYDDLRCGLTHEYTIKRKKFTIYNPGSEMSEDQIAGLEVLVNGVRTKCQCGILYSKPTGGRGAWLIINPKYWLDFKDALEIYWKELNDEKNRELRRNSFKRAREINFLEFEVL
jgi:hypothetical protein